MTKKRVYNIYLCEESEANYTFYTRFVTIELFTAGGILKLDKSDQTLCIVQREKLSCVAVSKLWASVFMGKRYPVYYKTIPKSLQCMG